MDRKKAVVLLSGGLDSTTTLAIAKNSGFDPYALSIDYGQRNREELKSAASIAEHLGAKEHKILRLDLSQFGGSSLTTRAPIEQDRALTEIGSKIPSTYVPARNTVFLSLALAWAEVLGATDIFIGVNAIDTSGYPDCRPEFIKSFSQTANLATKLGTELEKTIVIHTPLQDFSKAQIVQKGLELGVDYSMTSTCYDPLPGNIPCGSCDACILRKKGFEDAGLADPLDIATK